MDETGQRLVRLLSSLDYIIRQTITYLELTGQEHAAKTLTEWREKARRDAGLETGTAG